MRKTIVLIGSLLLIAATGAGAAPSKASIKGEADLAKALAGRVAGKPVSCIQLHQIRSSRIYDDTAIVYEVGRVLYVNRPSGANFLDRDDILVTDTHSSQLCSIDTVRLLDQSSHFQSGSVGLSQFVPYAKPKS